MNGSADQAVYDADWPAGWSALGCLGEGLTF